ncbi:hypothetical protein ACFV4N_04805 [Actinosynnema sp. NPDC059797]
MQILDDDQYKALSFISAANRGGSRPHENHINQWMSAPKPKPGKPGTLIKAGRPARYRHTSPIVEAMRGASFGPLGNSEMISALSGVNSSLLRNTLIPFIKSGVFTSELIEPEVPAEYGPPTPPETFIEHLLRLEWIDKDERGGIGVTPLGRALLRSAEYSNENEDEALEVVVLDSHNELAYPTFVRRLAEMGDALVIDPYLRLEQLLTIKAYTTVSRILISARVKQEERAAMAVLINSGSDHEIEIRVAANGVLHDRIVAGRDAVLTIGTSINTIGMQHPTVLTPLPQVAADAFRDHAEQWWDDAEFLAAYPPYEDADEEEDSTKS